jgi:hypothetical protein
MRHQHHISRASIRLRSDSRSVHQVSGPCRKIEKTRNLTRCIFTFLLIAESGHISFRRPVALLVSCARWRISAAQPPVFSTMDPRYYRGLETLSGSSSLPCALHRSTYNRSRVEGKLLPLIQLSFRMSLIAITQMIIAQAI